MWIIQELAEMSLEEVEGADHYITRALQLQKKRPKLADTLFKMSSDEMVHSKSLLDMADAIIGEAKGENEELEEIIPVYNYIFRKQTERAAQVKAKHAIYKGA